ncbi:uncharacterized protein LOC131942206 [Physella acuta]|uniref:uncharacterized protein LOC131942206 n=1 Tax=Physella acuta TaxID=109671 RepID=UPI0027DE387D|nr:uncharacterized protein LOC131942206 [Physella acuta]
MSTGCWRNAGSCDSVTSCRAVFRCEKAGDYVIRWHCPARADDDFNKTGTGDVMCPDQLRHVTDCPPPVVCPSQGHVNITSDFYTDVILAIAVTSFAVLALALIIASTYKYWRMRRSRRPQVPPRQFLIRPLPVRYHSMWGAGQQQYDVIKPHNSPVYGSSYPDIYFSRPYEHLLTSSEDSFDKHMGPYTRRHSGQGHVRHSGQGHLGAGNKTKTDPSIVTGSFVFHQPGLGGKKTDGWSYPDGSGVGTESGESYHIYRGNLGQQPLTSSPRCPGRRDKCCSDLHLDFSCNPRISSISIPTYGPQPAHQRRDLREEKTENFLNQTLAASSRRASRDSPYGHTDTPRAGYIRSCHSGHTQAFVRVGLNMCRHARRPSSELDELSYDSFLNDHLRELAAQGAASSSTLDVGFRHKMSSPSSHSRY